MTREQTWNDTDTRRPIEIKRLIPWEVNLHGPSREQH